jgi:hypothetical protein
VEETQETPQGDSSVKEMADEQRVVQYCRPIPEITVSDFSLKEDPAETSWCMSFIRASMSPATSIRITQEEDSMIIQMLRDALKSAEDEDGRVPTSRIDYVYDCVVRHFKASLKTSARQIPKWKRQMTGRATKRKAYRYARTQALYAKDPGLLAKLIRENTAWPETENIPQLPKRNIEELYKNLLGDG